MRLPVLTFGTILLAAVMMAVSQLHALFYFELYPVISGEWWRLLTAHLIHSDWEHWFWNMAALAVLGSYLEKQSSDLWFQSMLTGIASVNILLLSGWSQVTTYCGLSGVLNTLLVLALFHYWRETRSGWVITAGIICLSKLILELLFGVSLLTDIAWPPFPPAHLAGTLAGVFLLLTTKEGVTPVRIIHSECPSGRPMEVGRRLTVVFRRSGRYATSAQGRAVGASEKDNRQVPRG